MKTRPSKRVIASLVATALLLAALGFGSTLHDYQRSASLLLRFKDPKNPGRLATLGEYEIAEIVPRAMIAQDGSIHGRLYLPLGIEHPPAIVLVHGVHHLGIEEPRLINFARTLAQSGVAVFTPEVAALADYRVEPESIDSIGTAAHFLRGRLRANPVGIMGLSFAGGLALLAAADPRYSPDIGYVIAVGAHHDLERVARFLATSEIQHPDGSIEHLQANQYGTLVLAYADLESFFSKHDLPAAHDAMRLWLWERFDAARAQEIKLTPAGKEKIETLFRHNMDVVGNGLLAEIDRRKDSMLRVSPRGHLSLLHVPVFLLHGEGDTVIPASETLWLAQEVPPGYLRTALISPAVSHVDMQNRIALKAEWQLVAFMANVLREAEDSSQQELKTENPTSSH